MYEDQSENVVNQSIYSHPSILLQITSLPRSWELKVDFYCLITAQLL
tara:strand:- start:151 stop:291 length:141 start_codon:yes stop_codon:yes gene_type:complete